MLFCFALHRGFMLAVCLPPLWKGERERERARVELNFQSFKFSRPAHALCASNQIVIVVIGLCVDEAWHSTPLSNYCLNPSLPTSSLLPPSPSEHAQSSEATEDTVLALAHSAGRSASWQPQCEPIDFVIRPSRVSVFNCIGEVPSFKSSRLNICLWKFLPSAASSLLALVQWSYAPFLLPLLHRVRSPCAHHYRPHDLQRLGSLQPWSDAPRQARATSLAGTARTARPVRLPDEPAHIHAGDGWVFREGRRERQSHEQAVRWVQGEETLLTELSAPPLFALGGRLSSSSNFSTITPRAFSKVQPRVSDRRGDNR